MDLAEIQRQLDLQNTTLGIVLDGVRRVLDKWLSTILTDFDLIDDAWWMLYANTEMQPEFAAAFDLAIVESIRQSPFAVSWTKINPQVRLLAGELAFDLVNLDNPRGIIRPRVGFLSRARADLASGVLDWVDLEDRLTGMFDEYRSRLIARTETTTLWARAHQLAALEVGGTEKRSIRAELGRPCPTNVCNDAQAEGWIPIGEEYAAGKGPAFHPHCYCLEEYR